MIDDSRPPITNRFEKKYNKKFTKKYDAKNLKSSV